MGAETKRPVEVGQRKLAIFELAFYGGFVGAGMLALTMLLAVWIAKDAQEPAVVSAFLEGGVFWLSALQVPTLLVLAGNGVEWIAKGLGGFLSRGAPLYGPGERGNDP